MSSCPKLAARLLAWEVILNIFEHEITIIRDRPSSSIRVERKIPHALFRYYWFRVYCQSRSNVQPSISQAETFYTNNSSWETRKLRVNSLQNKAWKNLISYNFRNFWERGQSICLCIESFFFLEFIQELYISRWYWCINNCSYRNGKMGKI